MAAVAPAFTNQKHQFSRTMTEILIPSTSLFSWNICTVCGVLLLPLDLILTSNACLLNFYTKFNFHGLSILQIKRGKVEVKHIDL